METPVRELCLRCRRPQSVCWCSRIVEVPTRTRVVLLQHPREGKVAIGTARMAHLALPNSELHQGIVFGDRPAVRALIDAPGTVLLFPGPGARPPSAFAPEELRNVVVIDGTWAQAKKVYKHNPLLHRLPRVGLVPRRPGNYRIRKEPAPDCLATIEAVIELLGDLEGDFPRFERMLNAFEFMVETQIAHARTRVGPPRHKKERERPQLLEARLRERLGQVVLIHAEVNAHARASGVAGTPELLHLAATRPLSGETFDAVLAPRRPLAPSAAHHLELPEQAIRDGVSLDEARARWRAFLREDDVFAAWGRFPWEQLAEEDFATRELFDLRTIVARRLQARPGSPFEAAGVLGVPSPREGGRAGRAGRVVEALEGVVHALESLPLARAPQVEPGLAAAP
jgi:DTW domain-containing protein YfiP